MEENLKKFLDFNGKKIYFLAVDGVYWIAIKPICEALEVNFDRQYKNMKDDKILGPAYAVQPMQVEGDQLRNWACLPEFYVYGWIFSIKSESEALLEYKWKCYKLLYDYFHGTITNRFQILKEKTETDLEIERLEEELKQSDSYKKLQELKNKRTNANKQLNKLDKAVIEEKFDLWHQDWVIKNEQQKTEQTT